MKQNLAKIFYRFHLIHNMNICENKQILRWSVFCIAWFLEKMTLKIAKTFCNAAYEARPKWIKSIFKTAFDMFYQTIFKILDYKNTFHRTFQIKHKTPQATNENGQTHNLHVLNWQWSQLQKSSLKTTSFSDVMIKVDWVFAFI